MKKCIVFARVSTPQQDLEQQTTSLVKSANSIGYTDDSIIIIKMKESGISLTEEERQGISILKRTILDDEDIETVICWEISRLARRADIIYSMRDFFVEHHIRWIVMTPYIELIDINGNINQTTSLLLAVFTSFAESEMNLKKERAKRVYEYRKSLNKFAGGKILFGYAVDADNNFIIDKDNSLIIIKLFNMYASGEYSFRLLAKEMKSLGYFENQSSHTLASRLSKYINDERYCGSSIAYPPIISRELFERCQEITKVKNIIQKPVNKHEMLCKGLIFSKLRGISLIPEPAKGVYQTHPDYGKPSLTISAKYIDPLILEFTQSMIEKYLSNPQIIDKEYEEAQQKIFKKISSATKDSIKIEERINRAEELYIDGSISKEKLDKKIKKLKDEYHDLKRLITKLDNEYNIRTQNYVKQKPVVLDEISFSDKRYYVKYFISRIEIDKERPLSRRSIVYINSLIDNKIYKYLLYSQNSKYKKKTKSPELLEVICA